MRRLAAQRLFRISPYCKGTIHLQTSMPSSGFECRLYGITVSITNHYNGWAAKSSSGILGFHATGLGFKPWAEQGRLSLSSLEWIDKLSTKFALGN
ncbi:hypothetical protein TNCV_4282711 [Trichonephila clavipes]|nr:hypothetical protein TNCV_4282711 [Trichonephila clavipes]